MAGLVPPVSFAVKHKKLSNFQSSRDFKIADCGPNYTYVCTGFLIMG